MWGVQQLSGLDLSAGVCGERATAVSTGRRASSHPRRKKLPKVCVNDALQSPHMLCQAEPSYLGHKTLQKIEITVLLSAWHREKGSCMKHHNFCARYFMHKGGFTTACGVSVISAVSNGLWL